MKTRREAEHLTAATLLMFSAVILVCSCTVAFAIRPPLRLYSRGPVDYTSSAPSGRTHTLPTSVPLLRPIGRSMYSSRNTSTRNPSSKASVISRGDVGKFSALTSSRSNAAPGATRPVDPLTTSTSATTRNDQVAQGTMGDSRGGGGMGGDGGMGGGGGDGGMGGGGGAGGGGRDGYFQYAKVPQMDTYEFGFRKGNPYHFIERHESRHGPRFRTKVHWGDKRGGYGEHYWEYNHMETTPAPTTPGYMQYNAADQY